MYKIELQNELTIFKREYHKKRVNNVKKEKARDMYLLAPFIFLFFFCFLHFISFFFFFAFPYITFSVYVTLFFLYILRLARTFEEKAYILETTF